MPAQAGAVDVWFAFAFPNFPPQSQLRDDAGDVRTPQSLRRRIVTEVVSNR